MISLRSVILTRFLQNQYAVYAKCFTIQFDQPVEKFYTRTIYDVQCFQTRTIECYRGEIDVNSILSVFKCYGWRIGRRNDRIGHFRSFRFDSSCTQGVTETERDALILGAFQREHRACVFSINAVPRVDADSNSPSYTSGPVTWRTNVYFWANQSFQEVSFQSFELFANQF